MSTKLFSHQQSLLRLRSIALRGLKQTPYEEFLSLSESPLPWHPQDACSHRIGILRIVVLRQLLKRETVSFEIQQLMPQLPYMNADNAFMFHCEATRVYLSSQEEKQVVQHILKANKLLHDVDKNLKDYWYVIMSILNGYLLNNHQQLYNIQQARNTLSYHHPYSIAWNSIVQHAHLSWAYHLNGYHKQALNLSQHALNEALQTKQAFGNWRLIKLENLYLQTHLGLSPSTQDFTNLRAQQSSQPITPLEVLLNVTQGVAAEKKHDDAKAQHFFQKALEISHLFHNHHRYILLAYHHFLHFHRKKRGITEIVPVLEKYSEILKQMNKTAKYLHQSLHIYPYPLNQLNQTLDAHQIIDYLSDIGQEVDQECDAHTNRVGDLSCALASTLGLPNPIEIGQAARLHDLGKIKLPNNVRFKPGPLTSDERESMKLHTTKGADMLSKGTTSVVQLAQIIARSHHERWDGTGYPDGLAGTEIPLAARITAVADVFDALTSHRPYKPAWSEQQAHHEIHKLAGKHFDPNVVKALDLILSSTIPYRHRI